MLTAESIMTDSLVTIHPEASVDDAIELLIKHGISGVPVVDDDLRLVGVITEFALLATVYDHSIKQESVAEHMTRDVITIDIDDTIRRAADLCIAYRVRRLPVLKNGRLVGLTSRRDVLRSLHTGNSRRVVGETSTTSSSIV